MTPANRVHSMFIVLLKMASPAKKARKSNFSAPEIAVLTEKYENIDTLQCIFTNSVKKHKEKQSLGDDCCCHKCCRGDS